jgi:hypothetical protein
METILVLKVSIIHLQAKIKRKLSENERENY